MYSAFTLGIALWLVYGLLIEAWPVVFANVVTLALASSILWMRLRFGAAASANDTEA
jgi:MtN3 and saliva related transmembrane protein